VEELNIKPRFWKDLLTDEPFTRKDIIHLQVGIFRVSRGPGLQLDPVVLLRVDESRIAPMVVRANAFAEDAAALNPAR